MVNNKLVHKETKNALNFKTPGHFQMHFMPFSKMNQFNAHTY